MGTVWKERQSWRAAYRDEAGKQHTRSFSRHTDAKRWVATEEAKVVRGDWIDPSDTRFTIVRGVFRAAVADRLIASDPTIGVVLPRKRRAEAAMSIPTSVDIAKVLRAAEPERRPTSRPGFTAYVALCAFAGLRRGEALGVQVGDVDFLGRTLRGTRQLQRAKAADIEAGRNLVEATGGIAVVIRPPKYESERTIYLPDSVVAILAEHVRLHTPDGDPSRWLFDEGGRPWHDNLVDYRWRSTRAQAGVTHKLHELRHYFASGLIAAGCDVVTVQRAMGHASATTTLGTYAHLWPTAEDRTRTAAAGMADEVLSIAPSNQPAESRSRQ